MYFDDTNKQWLSDGGLDVMKFGEELKGEIPYRGEDIPAGTVMVFIPKDMRYAKYFFQTLVAHRFEDLQNTSLITYEPGSVVHTVGSSRRDTPVIPTFRFRNCRFPSPTEYVEYYTYHVV